MMILYTMSGCKNCELLKSWLKENMVEFEEKNFDTTIQTDLIMLNIFDSPPILKNGEKILVPSLLFDEDGSVQASKIMEVMI